MATLEEKKRLEELLASFPTTEAEDEKLLTGPLMIPEHGTCHAATPDKCMHRTEQSALDAHSLFSVPPTQG